MKTNRAQEIKVGLFAIIAIIFTVLILQSLDSDRGLFGKQQEYEVDVRINSAATLEINRSRVSYGGKEIGLLKAVEIVDVQGIPDENAPNIQLLLSVWDIRPLHSNSIVRIKAKGALGGSYLEVVDADPRGTAFTVLAAENKPFPPLRGESGGSIFDISKDEILPLVDKAENLIETIQTEIQSGALHQTILSAKNAMGAAETMLVTAEPRLVSLLERDIPDLLKDVRITIQSVRPILEKLDTASERLDPLLGDAHLAINDLSESTQRVMEGIDTTIQENRPAFRGTIQEMRQLAVDLQAISRDLAEGVGEVIYNVTDTLQSNRDEIDAILAHLEVSSENLNSLLEKLRREPWRAVWKSPPSPEPGKVMAEWDQSLLVPDEKLESNAKDR